MKRALMEELSEVEKDFICSSINRRGDGGHPVANREQLPYFIETYAKECVEKSLKSGNLTEKGEKLANQILIKLGM